jgi:hypothetical protein
MVTPENDLLQQARTMAQMAAQWLQLLQFAAHKGAPVFSPSLCHYHDMLDPSASDGARLKSCRSMLQVVERRMVIEDYEGEETQAILRSQDPYGMHWRTTRDGAALWLIANLLTVAIKAFEKCASEK